MRVNGAPARRAYNSRRAALSIINVRPGGISLYRLSPFCRYMSLLAMAAAGSEIKTKKERDETLPRFAAQAEASGRPEPVYARQAR